jgi:hypothetical protein
MFGVVRSEVVVRRLLVLLVVLGLPLAVGRREYFNLKLRVYYYSSRSTSSHVYYYYLYYVVVLRLRVRARLWLTRSVLLLLA